jgi:hypothetical protein
MLPALLARTDVVLELRDARLPLTSVNKTFEGMLLRHQVVEKKPPRTMTPTITVCFATLSDLHVLFICQFRYMGVALTSNYDGKTDGGGRAV